MNPRKNLPDGARVSERATVDLITAALLSRPHPRTFRDVRSVRFSLTRRLNPIGRPVPPHPSPLPQGEGALVARFRSSRGASFVCECQTVSLSLRERAG